MKYPIYNQKGEKVSDWETPKEIFDVPFNKDLVHQVLVAEAANKRQTIAHTKTRGEVSGGGKKPWRQKGTGRARHGSTRSPIWKGGGVTFGPSNETIFKKKLTKKMKKKALLMLLVEKIRQNLMFILEKIELEAPKTKEVAGIISNLKLDKGSLLIASEEKGNKLFLAGRNIKNVSVLRAQDINALNVASSKFLIITEKDIKKILA